MATLMSKCSIIVKRCASSFCRPYASDALSQSWRLQVLHASHRRPSAAQSSIIVDNSGQHQHPISCMFRESVDITCRAGNYSRGRSTTLRMKRRWRAPHANRSYRNGATSPANVMGTESDHLNGKHRCSIARCVIENYASAHGSNS